MKPTNKPIKIDYSQPKQHHKSSQNQGQNQNQNNFKIYIDDYNPKDLKPHLHKLNDIYKNSKTLNEFITDRGILIIESDKIYRLKYVDVPVIKKGKLFIDKSRVTRENILSQIPYKHFYNQKIVKYYGNSSELRLVIEGKKVDGDFEPDDFYFLANEFVDFDSPIIAEELDWFLSVLK
jgi:hypothetical protein